MKKERIRIELRATSEEKRTIAERAAERGMSMSEYILARTVYDAEGADGRDWAALREATDSLKEAKRELTAQGANINQIASAANAISRDRRSRSSQEIATALRRFAEKAEPAVREAAIRAREAIADMREAAR